MKRKHIIIYSIIVTLIGLLVLINYISYTQKRVNYFKLNTVCFERDILPVFIKNCSVVGCHDEQSGSGSYKFVDYNSIIKSVKPFKPERSMVYKSITGKGASIMPPGQELTENEIIMITVWIGQGAGNTVCPLSAMRYLDDKYLNERKSGLSN